MALHNDFGRWGEDLAARYLEERGFEILARNWRHEYKEVDITSSMPVRYPVIAIVIHEPGTPPEIRWHDSIWDL